MHATKILMGMPITVCIVDASNKDIDNVFLYFQQIDERFSTYKKNSEITKFNRGEIKKNELSEEMKTIFSLAEKTKQDTNGYFDIIQPNGIIDPSGLVKGWAIWQVGLQLSQKAFKNFFIDCGGDIQVAGVNEKKEKWMVGIKSPFNEKEIIKRVGLTSEGIATSGTYIRGMHIYNPHNRNFLLQNIVSVTVIGPNVYEADRFATAAFAMQEKGISFLEKQEGLEGYMIDKDGMATMTSGFEKYVIR